MLGAYVGPRGNLLEEDEAHCRQLYLPSPILSGAQAHALGKIHREDLQPRPVDITYPKGLDLQFAIRAMHATALQIIEQGGGVLLLSDAFVGPERVAIPALLAVSSLHHHLIRCGLRMRTAIILESGQLYTAHDMCVLIGYGADAIHPWLAYQGIRALVDEGMIEAEADAAITQYRKALEGGLLKVMSKMGISTLQAYKGAQIFESLGLDQELIDAWFTGTITHLPGVGLAEIEQDALAAHERAFGRPITAELPLGPRRTSLLATGRRAASLESLQHRQAATGSPQQRRRCLPGFCP
jgi:glutamate synthase (NADPH/NADH) large chain